MLDENLLTAKLDEIGYAKIKKYRYRFVSKNKNIDHFLIFSLYGDRNNYLIANFGIRNPDAERFSEIEMKKYGGKLYKLLPINDDFACTMQFSVGMVARWGARYSLTVSEFPVDQLVAKISLDIKRKLLPIIDNINDAKSFLHFLLKNEEVCSWTRVNGSIRAAQIVSLSKQVGKNPDEIKHSLVPFKTLIATNLDAGMDPDWFIDKIIADSQVI